MDMYNARSGILQEFARLDAEDAAAKRRTASFLASPNKADKLVASITSSISPSSKKAKRADFATETEAVDSLIPSGHPLKGFGPELHERLSRVVRSGRGQNLNPAEVADYLARKMLSEPGRSGAPRLIEANEFKRRADTAFFSFGEDASVRKPLGSQYDEWLGRMRALETPEAIAAMLRKSGDEAGARKVLEEASPIATPGGILLNAGIGAAAGGLIAGPAGAVLGGVGGVIGEVFGKPISKAVTQTDWYNARVGPLTSSRTEADIGGLLVRAGVGAVPGLLRGGVSVKGLVQAGAGAAVGAASGVDTGKALLAEMAPYVAAGGAVDAALFGAFLTPRAAAKAIAANPSAKTIAGAEYALRQSRKLFKEGTVVDRAIGKVLNPEYTLGVNEDFVNGWKNIVAKAVGKEPRSQQIMRRLSDVTADQIKGMDEAHRLKFEYDLRRAGLAEDEESAAWAARTIRKFDPTAMEDAMRHPEGFVAGIPDAHMRQRARALAGDLNGTANKALDNEIWTTAKAFERKSRGSTKFVAKQLSDPEPSTHELLFAGDKTYSHPEVAVDDAHKLLYGADRAAPKRPVTANSAELVDSVAVATGKAPEQALAEMQGLAATFETGPAKQAVIATNALTDISAAIPDDAVNSLRPVGTARKLSAKMQAVKDEFMRRRMSPEEFEDYMLERKYQAAKTDLEERLALRKKILAEEEPVSTTKVTLKDGRTLHLRDGADLDEVEETLKRRGVLAEDEDLRKLMTKRGAKEVTYDATKVATDAEAAEAPVDKIRGKKEKLAAEEQTKALERQRAEEARYLKMSPVEADAEIKSLAESWQSGTTAADDALVKMNNILDVMYQTGDAKFASEEGMHQWIGQYDNLAAHLRKVVNNKSFMAAFGVGAGVLNFFLGGKEAEAGTIDTAVKGGAKILEAMKDARYLVETTVADNKYLLKYNEFQQGLRGTLEGGPAAIVSKLKEMTQHAAKDSLRYRAMSPGMVFDEIFGAGKNIMNNPAVFRASYQAAEYNNILRARKVVGNILNEAGIKSDAQKVRAAFQPLTEDMAKQVEYEWAKDQIKTLRAEMDKVAKNPKKYSADLAESIATTNSAAIAEHEKTVERLAGAIPEYHRKWAEVAEKTAHESSSVRTFLALGDSPDFQKYPFLKNVKFTTEEQVAIGRMREQLAQYKQRLGDIGEETISGWYAPHILHPDFNLTPLIDKMGGPHAGQAYMRIYRRSFASRPLMPDLEQSLMQYVSDTERRIQNITFWKKEGWQTVMDRTAHLPAVHNAFKTIQDGVRPPEATAGNKFAQRYMEFESVKRLFLSPSATLKHVIKVTGDMAQRGLGETAEATPGALKALGIRLAEANPRLRESLSKLGFTAATEQDKLIQDYFKSLVPAHGTRRMLLDFGFTGIDEVFARAKSLWGKVQDVGASGISLAELGDRGLTLMIGKQIAEKRGLTIEQALYGTYDMLLRNNFLGRELNPGWLKNPKIKAFFMFQGTPFKIFERRMVNFLRSGRVIKDLGEEIFTLTKADYKNGNFENTRKILKDLRDIRSLVKSGEHEFKANLFLDAAMRETDFFGSPVISTFMRDLLIVGAGTYTAGSAGMNLYHHFFHLPFLQSTTDEPTINMNPGLSAIFRGMAAWKRREEGDEEFLTTKIMQRWLGKGWYSVLPDTVRKAHRITEDDIPKIYNNSRYKYLFAIPSKH